VYNWNWGIGLAVQLLPENMTRLTSQCTLGTLSASTVHPYIVNHWKYVVLPLLVTHESKPQSPFTLSLGPRRRRHRPRTTLRGKNLFSPLSVVLVRCCRLQDLLVHQGNKNEVSKIESWSWNPLCITGNLVVGCTSSA